MPFLVSMFAKRLQENFDPKSSTFKEHAKTNPPFAKAWSEAVKAGAQTVIFPKTATIDAAEKAMYGKLLGSSYKTDSGGNTLAGSIHTFAITCALGVIAAVPAMQGVPPSGPPPIQSAFPSGKPVTATNIQLITQIGDIIASWFPTGLSISISTGTPIPWA